MQIKITGKELKVTDAINDYVERKMERIAKYFDDAEADVLIRVEKCSNSRNESICKWRSFQSSNRR